jgi:hypothetical protein
MERLRMAILGFAFLIGPMSLMVLRNQLYTTLTTTTAFVFGFGLAMSFVPTFVNRARVLMKAVLTASAGYAAVLVPSVRGNDGTYKRERRLGAVTQGDIFPLG